MAIAGLRYNPVEAQELYLKEKVIAYFREQGFKD